MPKGVNQNIVLKENIDITKTNKDEIIQLINKKQNLKEIETIGKITIKQEQKELLLKKEKQNYKLYYLNLIGVYAPKIAGNIIIFKENTLENEKSSNAKDDMQKNQISPTEKEKLEKFLEEIKVIEIIQKIKLQERNIAERTNYNKTIKENEPRKTQEKKQTISKNEKENIKIQQKQEKQRNKLKDINIKQEVKMDTRVTDMKNLHQVLQKDKAIPKLDYNDKASKMGIVESDDLKKLKNEKGQKEKGHSSRYEAVVITKQGTIKNMNLENDKQEGTNPLEKNYQVKQNEEIQKGDVLTRLKAGEGTISIEKGKYGEVEVYHSPRKTLGGKNIEGNKSLDRQLETSTSKNPIKGTDIDLNIKTNIKYEITNLKRKIGINDIETLKLAQEYNDGYRSVERGYQEIEKHYRKNPHCEEKPTVKDIDGDENTKSHTHETEEYVELSTGEKVTYNQLATRWGLYKDGKPDASYVKEKFKNKQQEDKKTEDVIEELDEEYEDPRNQQRR